MPVPTRTDIEREGLLCQGQKAQHENMVAIYTARIERLHGQLDFLEALEQEEGVSDNGRPAEVAAYVGDARGEDEAAPADGEGRSDSDGKAGDVALQEPHGDTGEVVELDS